MKTIEGRPLTSSWHPSHLMLKKFNKFEIILFSLAVIYTVFFTWLNIAKYYAFFSWEWENDAIKNQIAWNTAHGRILFQSIFNRYLFDHISPLFVVIALIYLILPHIFTWYFLTSLSFAGSAVILYKLASLIFCNNAQAFLVALTFLLYPPLHYLNLGAIDIVTFFVPLFFLVFYFYYKNNFLYFTIFMISAMSCKEHIPLVFVILSFFAFISKRSKRWILTPLLTGLAWFFISIWLLLPLIDPQESNLNVEQYLFYSLDAKTLLNTINFMISQPKNVLMSMFSGDNLLLFKRLFCLVCFIPFFSGVTFMGASNFLVILLQKGSLMHSISYRLADVLPFIFLGYIFGINRIKIILGKFGIREEFSEKFIYFFLVLSLLLCVNKIFKHNIYAQMANEQVDDKRFLEIKNIFDPIFYKMDEQDKIAWSMIRMIPDESTVSASGDLLIPLSHRKKLYEFGMANHGYDYFDADYIVINTKHMYFGAGNYEDVNDDDLKVLERLVEKEIFKVILKQGNFILLKKT